MNLTWHYDNIGISGHATCDMTRDVIIRGTGFKRNQPFEYCAQVTPNGWLVTIISLRGIVGSIQGSTFNLQLEIAAAAKMFTF